MITVGVADMKLSADPDDILVTHALGSCLGVAIYDPVARVGGLLHVMLPLSTIDPEKAKKNPFLFVDTGVPRLFLESYKLGAKKERIVLGVAGGSAPTARGNDLFEIGKRNIVMLRKLLWKNSVLMKFSDLAGVESRTMYLHMDTGRLMVRNAENVVSIDRTPDASPFATTAGKAADQ